MQAHFCGGPKDGDVRSLRRRAQKIMFPRKSDDGVVVEDVYELRDQVEELGPG